MRGDELKQDHLFSYVDLESRIPEKHQIRRIKKVVDKALIAMSDDFDEMYSHEGVIPPKLTAMKSRKINSPAATVEWA